MNARTPTATCALDLARAKVAVFPIAPGTMRPLGAGPRDATYDLDTVWSWWESTPNANVGLPTGPGGFDVVDIDNLPNRNGFAAYRQMQAAGLLDGWAMKASTPNGGLHIYFPARPDGQRDASMPHVGVDFRGAGGYVVAPPSLVDLADGSAGMYRVLERREEGLGYVDAAAIATMFPRPEATSLDAHTATRMTGILDKVRHAQPAARGGLLRWAARTCLDLGVSDLSDLEAAAADAGLDSRVIDRTLNHAREQHIAQPTLDLASPTVEPQNAEVTL